MTLVLDACACSEFLLGTPVGSAVADAVEEEDIHAPHLVLSECLSVLRGWALGGRLSNRRAGQAVADLAAMPWTLWDASPLIRVMWDLRHNVSSSDATYLALATMLGVPLLTTDARLAAAAPAVCTLAVAPP